MVGPCPVVALPGARGRERPDRRGRGPAVHFEAAGCRDLNQGLPLSERDQRSTASYGQHDPLSALLRFQRGNVARLRSRPPQQPGGRGLGRDDGGVQIVFGPRTAARLRAFSACPEDGPCVLRLPGNRSQRNSLDRGHLSRPGDARSRTSPVGGGAGPVEGRAAARRDLDDRRWLARGGTGTPAGDRALRPAGHRLGLATWAPRTTAESWRRIPGGGPEIRRQGVRRGKAFEVVTSRLPTTGSRAAATRVP